MNIKSEGLGRCNVCGTPIMQAIGQPGVKGVCFGCLGNSEPKTGRTVVVQEENETENGPIRITEVKKDAAVVLSTMQTLGTSVQHAKNTFHIKLSIDDLSDGDITKVVLQAVYDGIDNMPPFATLKETKKALAVQEQIQKLLKKKTKGDKNVNLSDGDN